MMSINMVSKGVDLLSVGSLANAVPGDKRGLEAVGKGSR